MTDPTPPLPGLPAGEAWYSEVSDMWPGQALSLRVKEVLFQAKSDFQDVLVFESETYGRVLVLDGCIQLTQRDEFSYQEMMAHIPLCALKGPLRRVLVVGGGDGGVLRELSRHTCLERIECAEIDAMVPETSRKFFPEVAVGFDVRTRNSLFATPLSCAAGREDDAEHLRWPEDAAPDSYDVIIVDSSDPVGPASVLFTDAFFRSVHRALRPGGILCTQGECAWLHLDLIKQVQDMLRQSFEGGEVAYAYTSIPTYPSGQIGFMLACKAGSEATVFATPQRQPPAGGVLPPLRYYNAAVHRAALALPQFVVDGLSA